VIKAIFMDYYGTVAYENGPISIEVVKRIYKNSDASSPGKVFRYWWETFKERLNEANGDNFRLQHDVALENFKGILEHFHLYQKIRKSYWREWRNIDVQCLFTMMQRSF